MHRVVLIALLLSACRVEERFISDSDDDGVGDLCDPQPGAADQIVYFEGFHHALSNDWTRCVAALVENDSLTLQGVCDTSLPIITTGRATLLAGITMVEQPTNGVWIGLPYEKGVGGNFCELTASELQLWRQPVGSAAAIVDKTAFSAKLDTQYVYSIQRVGGQQYKCTARSQQATAAVELVVDNVADVATTNVGIGADATTRIAWLMLVHQ